MECIKILTDEEFGIKPIDFNNPKIRNGARGIIINEDGKLAIFNKVNKNEYKLPGGGIKEGETPEEAFKREALEETGCEIEIIKCLGTIEEHKSQENFKQISYLFIAKVIRNNNKCNFTEKEKNEGARLLWVDENEAINLVKNCIDSIKASEYENVYHTKFIVKRDTYILEEYINNKN